MMAEHRQELELIDRAVAGDHAALERLMVMHHGRLAAELTHKLPESVRSLISVEDILQEAYVIVFQQVHTFRPHGPGAFYRWIATIAERRLLDAIKAEKAAKRGGGRVRALPKSPPPEESVVEWLELLAIHERTPSRSVAGREAVVIVQRALAGLKQDYREALRLRYIEGLPVAETAVRMNRTEGAVCLLCHRGLKQMSKALGSSAQFFESGE